MKNLIFILLLLLSVSVSAQRNKLKNITEKNGKIGIGTTQPDELLTVKGKVHAQEVIVDLNGAIAHQSCVTEVRAIKRTCNR